MNRVPRVTTFSPGSTGPSRSRPCRRWVRPVVTARAASVPSSPRHPDPRRARLRRRSRSAAPPAPSPRVAGDDAEIREHPRLQRAVRVGDIGAHRQAVGVRVERRRHPGELGLEHPAGKAGTVTSTGRRPASAAHRLRAHWRRATPSTDRRSCRPASPAPAWMYWPRPTWRCVTVPSIGAVTTTAGSSFWVGWLSSAAISRLALAEDAQPVAHRGERDLRRAQRVLRRGRSVWLCCQSFSAPPFAR